MWPLRGKLNGFRHDGYRAEAAAPELLAFGDLKNRAFEIFVRLPAFPEHQVRKMEKVFADDTLSEHGFKLVEHEEVALCMWHAVIDSAHQPAPSTRRET